MTAEEAIEHELSICHMSPGATPLESLYKLINWHTSVALDRTVSSAAVELYQEGYYDGMADLQEALPLNNKC